MPAPRAGEVAPAGDDGDNWARDATLVTKLPADLSKYVDPNARLEFTFKFLDVDESGAVTFASGSAEIPVTGLPSGQPGTIELELWENGVLKLKGSKADVTLQAGANREALTLQEITDASGNPVNPGTGGVAGADADLVLDVTIDGTVVGPVTGGVTFASVQTLAESSCEGCHAGAKAEAFWTSRGKDALTNRLNGTGGVSKMPKAPTQISDAERQQLLDYVTTLN